MTDDDDAKFNLVGPDLSASEWAELLKPHRRLAWSSSTRRRSASRSCASSPAPGRVVVTATDSTAQEFETVFAEWFVKALTEMAADADKNGRVSMLEAFTYASAAVRRWYDEHNQLPTERPLLDDDGDGVGTRGAESGGRRMRWRAARICRLPAEPVDAPRRALAARQAALEAQVDALKARRSSMAPDAYQAELERLLARPGSSFRRTPVQVLTGRRPVACRQPC